MIHPRSILLIGLLPAVLALLLTSCEDPEPTPDLTLPIRINAGGPAIGKPGQPDHWQSDELFVKGGKPYSAGSGHDARSARNAAPTAVYETVRRQDHVLRINGLPGGKYVVRFHFTEPSGGKKRAMDFRLNNRNVINNFNITKAAGGKKKVVIIDTTTKIKTGQPIIITGRKDKGDDILHAGIEILPVMPPPPPLDPVKDAPQITAALRAFTGAPTRLAWVQGTNYERYTSSNSKVILMGLDTEDGLGERPILSEPGPYSNPLFTADGKRLVFSNRATLQVHIIDWDGKNRRDLGPGDASEVWRDPSTGIDWVYLRSQGGRSDDPIVRRQVDDPEIQEPVWNRTPNGHADLPWFQLSADGTRFADAFPWPACGFGDLTDDTWKKTGNGCWPSISPDNSYRFFYFHGSHRDISLFDEGGHNERRINLSNIPGQENQRVYHPRWSNHVSFFTVTSPELSPKCELYLGKFNPTWHHVEEWVRVTHNDRADLFGDAWIQPGDTPAPGAVTKRPHSPPPSHSPAPPSTSPPPAAPPALAWLWNNARSQNESPPLPGEANPHLAKPSLTGTARFGPHSEMILDGGHAITPAETGPRITAACHQSNEFTVEAIIHPSHLNQSGSIVSLGESLAQSNLTLTQEEDRLILLLRTPDTGAGAPPHKLTLGKLDDTRPHHVLISARPEDLRCYINGDSTLETTTVAGPLDSWTPMPLSFGSHPGAAPSWSGSLEGIALYHRALTHNQATDRWQHAKKILDGRPSIPTTIVDAKLIESTPSPSLDDIAPYPRALVENVYEITKLIEGPALDSEKIVAFQWVIMGSTPLNVTRKVGDTVRLHLQPVEAHPQLQGEYRAASHEALEAPVYFDLLSHQR